MYARGVDLSTQEGRLEAIATGSKPNCLILDFAGNVERHGPIDLIKVKSKRGKNEESISVAPVKECPECHELVHASVMTCPACDYEFPAKPAHADVAGNGVVVAAIEPPRVKEVDSIAYHRHEKFGSPPSLRVVYNCGIEQFSEWIPIEDERSNVRKHAVRWFWQRGLVCPKTVDEALAMSEEGKFPKPATIVVKLDGKWWRVVETQLNWEGAAA
jgi:DNA repair protein RadD